MWWRRRQDEEDLRLYRNLLALLPYTVPIRSPQIPQQRATEPAAVVYYKPIRRQPGRHLGWE